MKRMISLICSICLFAFSLSACKKEVEKTQASVASSAFPLTINGITFESAPEKVVSLSPFLTDVIYDIEAEEALVGVCDYCEDSDISSMGTALNPDVDAIKSSQATLVMTMTPLDSEVTGELESAGITVMQISNPVSLETLTNLYASMIGILCGNADFQDTAQNIFSSANDTVNGFEKSDKTVLCIVSEHMNTAGAGTLGGDIISLLSTNAQSAQGYADIKENPAESDIVLADVSLRNYDISQYTDDSEVFYIDFSALENPNVANISALIAEICDKL